MNPRPSEATVLVVDNEARNLDVLDSILSGEGCSVVCCSTPEESLLALLGGDFAVILLDVQMPGMSGIELARTIKGRKKSNKIPIIFLTAFYNDDHDILDGYEAGAVDYITKPINPKILTSKIKIHIDLFMKGRELEATNAALETEVRLRKAAEDALLSANRDLEAKVEERTRDLQRLNMELQTSEIEVRKARDRAVAASGAKDAFIARLSHELRTPLNPVLLIASDGAENQDYDGDLRAMFRLIADQVEIEARLIDDLLDLTRIDSGKLRVDKGPVRARDVVEYAVSTIARLAHDKQVELRYSQGCGESRIFADRVRISQVLLNILSNALKFTPAGGTIQIADHLEDDTYIASIKDTGIGMSGDELDSLFEPFVQGIHAEAAGGDRYGGLGLGLAISKAIVELHQGTIEAISEGVGRGSTFRVSLPLLKSEEMKS